MTTRWWSGSRFRPLYWLLVAALLGLVAWALWPRPLPVEVAEARLQPLQVGFTEEGRTRLRDRFVVSAPVDGVLERIELEPGDAVRAGAPVAWLRPASAALLDPATRIDAEMRWRTAGDERRAAQAAVAAAAASSERADAALKRAEALAARQQIALDQRDEARRQARAATAELQSVRAQLQAAGTRLAAARAWLDAAGSAGDGSRLPIPAPVDGVLVRRNVESEGLVRAGQALLEVGDAGALEAVVEVLTADALRLRPGMAVNLVADEGRAAVAGRVRRIEPGAFTKISALGVEEQRVAVIVAMPADAAGAAAGLGDAFRVDAHFRVWASDSVLAVPLAALFRDGPRWAVYIVDRGRARLRHVDVGHLGESAAEVTRGLSAGEAVVLYPGDSVRDGLRVSASRD